MSSHSSVRTNGSWRTLRDSSEPTSTPLYSFCATLFRPLSSCISFCHEHHQTHHQSSQYIPSCMNNYIDSFRQHSDSRPFRFNRLHGLNESCVSGLSPLLQNHFDKAVMVYRTARCRRCPESARFSHSTSHDFSVLPFQSSNVEARQQFRVQRGDSHSCSGRLGNVDHNERFGVGRDFNSRPGFPNSAQPKSFPPYSRVPRHSSPLTSVSSAILLPQISMPPNDPRPRLDKLVATEINTSARQTDYDNNPQVYTSSTPSFPQTAHSASGLPPSEELYLLRHIVRAMDNGKNGFDAPVEVCSSEERGEDSIAPDCSTPDPDRSSRSTLSRIEPPLREDRFSLDSRYSFVVTQPEHLVRPRAKAGFRRRYHKKVKRAAKLDGFSRKVMHLALASSTPPESEQELQSLVRSSSGKRKICIGRLRRRENFGYAKSV